MTPKDMERRQVIQEWCDQIVGGSITDASGYSDFLTLYLADGREINLEGGCWVYIKKRGDESGHLLVLDYPPKSERREDYSE